MLVSQEDEDAIEINEYEDDGGDHLKVKNKEKEEYGKISEAIRTSFEKRSPKRNSSKKKGKDLKSKSPSPSKFNPNPQ